MNPSEAELAFGSRVSDFGFRVASLGFRVSGFRFRVSGFGFRVSGFGFRVSGFGFRVSDFGFRDRGETEEVAGNEAAVLVDEGQQRDLARVRLERRCQLHVLFVSRAFRETCMPLERREGL